MENDHAFAPRIYYLNPLLIGPLPAWEPHLERAAAMGFDHIAIAPPFAPGGSGASSAAGDIFLSADHDRIHPFLDFAGHSTEWLAALARAARAHDMSLLLDVVLDRFALEARVVKEQPAWFEPALAATGAVDPRHAIESDAAYARFDDLDASDHLTHWWAQQLRAFADAGVVGFRFLAPNRVAAHVWRRLAAAVREHHPLARFLAWTPGLERAASEALCDANFDAVFSSLRWWDYRSEWMAEEYASLARVGDPIAFPEAPFGKRLMAELREHTDASSAERAYRRALRVSATLGTGWLLPMGFEFGAREAFPSRQPLPDAFAAVMAARPFDLSEEIGRINGRLKPLGVLAASGQLCPLSPPDATVTALLRVLGPDARSAERAALLLVNPDLHQEAVVRPERIIRAMPGEFTLFSPVAAGPDASPEALAAFTLAPGEARAYLASRPAPILGALPPGRRGAKAAERRSALEGSRVPRIAIEAVTPSVDHGRFPAKRVVGEAVSIEADIFTDGHDQIAAAVVWRERDVQAPAPWRETPMKPLGNDRWRAHISLERLGAYEFTILAWRDTYGSLVDHIAKKRAAGQEVGLEIQEAQQLLAAVSARGEESGEANEEVAAAHTRLRALLKQFARASAADQLALVSAPETAALVAATRARDFLVRHEPVFTVLAERAAARFANWYELFPRSQSGDAARHGTFIDVINRLPEISSMGFDVLYFPPIHPIGRRNRKGKNNSLEAGPDDVGSPYAIGSAEGGHTAIHPELGSFDDFRTMLEAARAHAIEIALDFAIQCAPDHPWLEQHPGWFAWRPDGSLRYAENPPKKYQDIVNPDFYAEDALPSLWLELRDVIEFWIEAGVKIFRVDNPHTKPLPFWEWMIGSVRARHPEVIFLAEAFTRPKLMKRLAKLGFSQSYTYFTWRETRYDFVEYLSELTQTDAREYFRPNFFVNTPDINPRFLQRSGRPGFMIRAALAASLAGVWGVYSGFELCEAAALPNSEEYLDSEKYQLRVWDWHRPGNIIGEISLLNRIRRANPALHTHLGLTFLPCDNPQILFFEKSTPARDNVLLVAINLDPYSIQHANLEVPLWKWGLGDGGTLLASDLVSTSHFEMRGKYQQITLDPAVLPFAIRRVVPAPGQGWEQTRERADDPAGDE